MSPSALLTARQAAARLNVSRSTLYQWTESGRLPVARLSERCTRWRESDIDAFLEAQYQPAKPEYAPTPMRPRPTGDEPWRAYVVTEADYRPFGRGKAGATASVSRQTKRPA